MAQEHQRLMEASARTAHRRLYGVPNATPFVKDGINDAVVHGRTEAVNPAGVGTALFGGNSNWRGPVWFPVNYLLIEALQKFHHFYQDDLKVSFSTSAGQLLNLWEVAAELSRRLTRIFLRDHSGRRPVYGATETLQQDPYWRDLILFYEYFHGDNGAGLGASHQTGWTALVAKLLQQSGE